MLYERNDLGFCPFNPSLRCTSSSPGGSCEHSGECRDAMRFFIEAPAAWQDMYDSQAIDEVLWMALKISSPARARLATQLLNLSNANPS